MKKILLVDDELRMLNLLKVYFEKEEFEVLEASDGIEALQKFDETVDIVVLDVMMPFKNGWEVLKEIRVKSKVPVIMLTAKEEEEDELNGFELGADEYITKPFRPKILIARVKAILRRLEEENAEYFECCDLKIDFNAKVAYLNDKDLDLSPKEYELLIFLVENKNQALTRDKILNGVWGFDYFGDERTVDTHIKRLRSKLKTKSNMIKTIRGTGYRFEV